MEIILSLFLVGFMLETCYLHIEFWINVIDDDEIFMITTLLTLPFFPIFGTIELVRRIIYEN